MNVLTLIDVEQPHRAWVAAFTWHLDLVPALLEVLVDATLPQIPVGNGSRFDKDQISGGGYRDNMQILDRFLIGDDGTLTQTGAAADATELWDWLTQYTAGVASWLNHDVPVPYALNPANLPPINARRPDADPLTARGLALITIGWLIDHADEIAEFHELDEHREAMFALIRRLRGRYGVFSHPRRARPTICQVCGERAVVIDWIDGANGSPRPVKGGKCRNCGQQYRQNEGTAS